MATIRDVARLAGVSPITVSRVVNHDEHVSPATRERVERAIAELAYIPNALGPSLRFKRTGMLALIVSDIMNPFWTTVARGVEDAANRQGYHTIICNTGESAAKQEKYVTFLLRKQVDGFLMVPISLRSLAQLLARKTPVVILDRRLPQVQVDAARGDSEGGSYQLTRHLIELGHRQIAIVTGPREHTTAIDRVAGYLRALGEAGLAESAQVHWGDYTQGSGSRSAHAALRGQPRPTAIVAASNFLAIGTMRALLEEGVRVPEDMSVVCFDDLPAELTIDPFFTVASQPAYELGQRATELLLQRLAGAGPEEPQEIVLPVEFVIRRSSAPLDGPASVGLEAASADGDAAPARAQRSW